MALTAPLILLACRPGIDRSGEENSGAAITFADVADATYAGIYEEPVALEDGEWEGEPFVPDGAARPSVMLVERLWLSGDLDGDANDEAVVLLAESSGGSGSYLYIAALGHRDGKVANLGTALVGDRVQVWAMRMTGEGVELDVIQQGPQDAACCPTQKATRTWVLDDDGLSELSPSLTGELSIADLEGAEWVLILLASGEPAPSEPEITLTVEDGQATGSAGCNRYFGALEEPTAGELEVGPLGSTRMACPEDIMDLETRYLEALQGVVGYSFRAGQLALSYRAANGVGALVFDQREN